jgi:CubicO group peptidase (beta-lactamase class C family)
MRQSPSRIRAGLVIAGVLLMMDGGPLSARGTQETPTTTQRIDKVFEQWDRPATPGCAVGVAQQGRVVYTQGYGMANLEYGVRIRPDTIFESGSVAKQFTAAAIGLLALDGKLSIDDPVRKYVPELPDFGTPILIRHFLTHTSGIRSQWPMLSMVGRRPGLAVHTVSEILELVSFQKEVNFQPGEEFLYNNTAFTLLGVIVQRVSGKPLAEFSQERLFKPLGMNRTQWRDDFTKIVARRATAYRMLADGAFRTNMPFTNVIGNGGLLTTVGDLLTWNENFDNPRVGGRALADQLQTRGRLNDGFEIEYGQGLYVQDYRGVREVSHGGTTAGYQTFLARFPEDRLSVAVLCNTSGTNPGDYAHQVADVFLGDKLRPVPTLKAIDVPVDVLVRALGLYRERSTDALLRLTWDKERKVVRSAGQTLTPTGDGVLSTADASQTLTFEAAGGSAAWPASTPERLTERQRGAKARVWHYESPWTPDPARLAEFVGDYVSDELGATYSVLEANGSLVVRFRPAQGFPLVPAFTDGFEGDGNTVRFTRDATGKVSGFLVSAGRVRHLRFVKR